MSQPRRTQQRQRGQQGQQSQQGQQGSAAGAASPPPVTSRRIRRNTLLLAACLACLYGMAELASALASVSFVAVTGSAQLAGAAPGLFFVAAALTALPAGRASDRVGRVPVLAGGSLAGVAGSGLAALAVGRGSAWVLVAALVLIGVAIGAVRLARLAAADMYPPAQRGRAISTVLFGALFGAVLGPLVFVPVVQTSNAGDTSGVWLAGAAFMVAGLATLAGVRPDPSRIAPTVEQAHEVAPDSQPPTSGPRAKAAVSAALVVAPASYAVMVAVMTLAGYLLITVGGQPTSAVFPLLAVHFVGMFGTALLVGRAVDRYPRIPVMVAGQAVVAVSVLVLAFGLDSLVLAGLGLFGTGVGWNISFVAATALLTDHTPRVRRGRVLGLNDFLSDAFGGLFALAGGFALAYTGLLGVTIALIVATAIPTAAVLLLPAARSRR